MLSRRVKNGAFGQRLGILVTLINLFFGGTQHLRVGHFKILSTTMTWISFTWLKKCMHDSIF